jgi:CheY-like chemotaxis protein
MKKFKIREFIFIDDDEVLVFVGKKILKMVGYDGIVSHFRNGLEAITNLVERIAQKEFDDESDPVVVLLDINMPIMNAWDFMNVFKEFPENIRKHFKIAIVTSSFNPADRISASKYIDLLEYINKPISSAGLLEFLKKHGFYEE